MLENFTETERRTKKKESTFSEDTRECLVGTYLRNRLNFLDGAQVGQNAKAYERTMAARGIGRGRQYFCQGHPQSQITHYQSVRLAVLRALFKRFRQLFPVSSLRLLWS
jgi:hypothetical protein